MYSIYDYYGMSNDLQNRYDAAKNAGSGQTVQPTQSTPTGNNAPFLPVTSTPQATQLSYSAPQTGASIYDSPTGDSGTFSATGNAYTSADLANYPSPSWMEPVHNAMFNVGTMVADMALPFSGSVIQQGRAYAMDPTNYSIGRNLTSEALNRGLNYMVGRTGLMGELTKGLSTGKQEIDMLSGLGIKGGVSSLINNFVNFVTGSIFGPAPSRGHNNMSGFDDDTYGYSSTAMTPAQIAAQHNISLGSLLSSSPYGGASYANEYAPGGVNNPDINAYPNTGGYATGPNENGDADASNAWGGPSGDWSGDAWGDSYY
jgi:hypothetical protein